MNNVSIAMSFLVLRNRYVKTFLILMSGISCLVFFYIFNPSTLHFFPPCPFHKLTGLHCPGCGSLRAMHHLLHGHPIEAFGLNPLMVLALPFIGFSFVMYFFHRILGKSLSKIFIPASYIWIFLWVVISFWILRNIPFYPFTLLAP